VGSLPCATTSSVSVPPCGKHCHPSDDNQGRWGHERKHDTVVTQETESNCHQRLSAASCKVHHLIAFMQVTAMNDDQRIPVATIFAQG
jgi:hypothetical protein